MAAAFLPAQPLERGLVIARAALVADRAAAAVEALELEARAAERNHRFAVSTLARSTEHVEMVREWGRLTQVEVMYLYRAAANVTTTETEMVAVTNRLNSAKANLTQANRWMGLLRAAQDVDEAEVFPSGFTIYGGYLHYYGECTGIMAD